jgi:predicted RNA-binding protein with PUA-like domain
LKVVARVGITEAMNSWLLKSEPSDYSFADLVADGRTTWTGVRNFEARNHLRAMRPGDLAFFFHTGKEKAVVGVAKVTRGPMPDPTAPGEDWASVELEAVEPLSPVPLGVLKATRALKGMALVRRGRLSVTPVTRAEWSTVVKLSKRAK